MRQFKPCLHNTPEKKNLMAGKGFEIKLPVYKIHQSLCNSTEFVDYSPDQSNRGIVQAGLLTKKANVVFKTPVCTPLHSSFNALTDLSASNEHLGFVGAVSSTDYATFLVKLNHTNGNFIIENEIKTQTYSSYYNQL